MTSISRVQKERILEELVRYYYSTGINPTLTQILQDMSEQIGEFPLGIPYPLPYHRLGKDRLTDFDTLNDIFTYIGINLDVLYETTIQQMQAAVSLQANLAGYIANLRAKRKRLMDRVDDYLLSLYDTDGYFHSVSDTFNSLSLVDLNFTSAFVDSDSGSVTIPMLTSATRRIPENALNYNDITSVKTTVTGVNKVTPRQLAPLSNAFDGFANTIWAIEVMTYRPREVEIQLRIDVNTARGYYELNRIEFIPYGITPVQMWVEVEALTSDQVRQNETVIKSGFGNRIQTSNQKMVLIGRQSNVKSIIVSLRKDKFDYHEEIDGNNQYKYIFGAKEIGFYETVYDDEAVLITRPLFVSEDNRSGKVIDAVSLTVAEEVPAQSNIFYYVASDIENANSADDFDWIPITPVNPDAPDPEQQVVRFEGAFQRELNISSDPSAPISLFGIDTANPVIGSRNPSISIIADQTIYRLAKFNEAFLDNTIRMEEGVDTVRVFAKNHDFRSDGMQLSYWAPAYLAGNNFGATVRYISILNGKDLYLGDVPAQSDVYLEFFVHSDTDHPDFYDTFSKSDQNSKLWDIRLFVNGNQVADMPIGTDSAIVPWKFQSGKNHIAMTMRMRDLRESVNLGSIRLMAMHNFNDFGIVKLQDWNFTTLFDMEHNEVTVPNSAEYPWLQPATFAVYNGEIISRRRPTDNLRIIFRQESGRAPSAIRLKAQMTREFTAERITPILNDYRVRFLYA